MLRKDFKHRCKRCELDAWSIRLFFVWFRCSNISVHIVKLEAAQAGFTIVKHLNNPVIQNKKVANEAPYCTEIRFILR